MKTIFNKPVSRHGKSIIGTICFTAALGSPAHAAILSIDFHQSVGNAVQSGFDGMVVSPDNSIAISQTFGSYTVTTAGGPTKAALTGTGNVGKNTRGRPAFTNSGEFTYNALFSERLVSLESATDPATGLGVGNGLYVSVSGLTANTAYTVQAWGLDFPGTPTDPITSKSGYVYLFDATNEANDYTSLTQLGTYTVPAGQAAPANNDAFSITGTVTSDASGTIVFKSISNIDGSGIMNGFTVSEVPEPSGALLGLCGLVIAIGARRR